jgi:hypothetical protein
MKCIHKLLLLILIFVSIEIKAQDWQCVRPGVTATFIDTALLNAYYNKHTMWVINIDSVKVHQGWTYHYGFAKMRLISFKDTYPNGYEYCYDAYGPSRMGIAMSALGGENFFFNSAGDGIRISTLKQPGESWICCRISDTTRLDAMVTSLGTDTIFGVVDSVKYISFQAKSISGELISHIMNDQVFVLSKEFGMITLYDFYSFPDYTPPSYINESPVHLLAGIAKQGFIAGAQNLTYREIFSFEPGDEFHTKFVENSMVPYYNGIETNTISRVLTSAWNSTNDAVTYQISRHIDYWSGWDDQPHYYTLDTIFRSYSFFSEHISGVNYYPEQSIFSYDTSGALKTVNSLIQYTNSDYNSRRVKSLEYNNIRPISLCADTLVGYSEWYWGESPGIEQYIDGCGGPYFSGGSTTEYHSRSTYFYLFYFKKGSETWGTPWDTTGWVLPHTIPDSQQFKVNIYPNPAFGQVNIEIPDEENADYRLEIFSLSGIKISEMNFTDSKFTFSISDYPKGMYFLKLYMDNLLVGQQKLVKQ